MEKEIEKAIVSIFEGLMASREQEVQEKFGDAIRTFVNSKYDFKNMDCFNLFINHGIEGVLESLVGQLNPGVKTKSRFNLFSVYRNYQYLDNNLRALIDKREGTGCVADKTRWLLNVYRDYLVTGDLPDMTVGDKCYWKPYFGTGQQWMDLCDGLMALYYGETAPYLSALVMINANWSNPAIKGDNNV